MCDTISECVLGNVLVGQKNTLLDLVTDKEFEKAFDLLAFVREFWVQTGYGYKGHEIINRAAKALQVALESPNTKVKHEEHAKLLAKFNLLSFAAWRND
jgi:hypothetical protein